MVEFSKFVRIKESENEIAIFELFAQNLRNFKFSVQSISVHDFITVIDDFEGVTPVLEGARHAGRRLVVAEAGIRRVFDHRPIVLVRAWKHAARVQPCELPVEVANIVWAVDVRLELRSDFSSVKGVEIDVQEEWMRFDLDDAVEAESRFRIFVKKSLKKIAGVAGNSVWQGRHALGANSLVKLVVRRPRRLRPRELADDHFVENDSERPPVNRETVRVVVQN